MKVILWFQTPQLPLLNAAINVVARTYGALEFVGAIVPEHTGGGEGSNISVNGKMIPLLDQNKIAEIEYDIVIVGGDKISMPDVLKQAKAFGLDDDKVVLDRTVCIPGFTLDNYKQLRNSQLSIFSTNCWGGAVYHAFGLPFLSPTINLFFGSGSFNKFLRDPITYINMELRYYKMNFNEKTKEYYPSFWLGDVEVIMLHYVDKDSVNTARKKWEERRLKINWYNTLFKSGASTPEELEKFDRLPFAKKICVVPFETNVRSGFYIDTKGVPDSEKWRFDLAVTNPHIWHYNLWDLLLYGKKTPINT